MRTMRTLRPIVWRTLWRGSRKLCRLLGACSEKYVSCESVFFNVTFTFQQQQFLGCSTFGGVLDQKWSLVCLPSSTLVIDFVFFRD